MHCVGFMVWNNGVSTDPRLLQGRDRSAYPEDRVLKEEREERCYQRTIVLSGAQRVGGASAEGHANRDNRGSARYKKKDEQGRFKVDCLGF